MDTENQQPNPVLLIHGIGDTGAVFNTMASYLRQRGWSIHTLDLIPNNGAVSLEQLAKQVDDYVATNFVPEQTIDLVGFSMGGIVSRYYLQRLGGIKRVQRFITISSPHYGTVIAYGSRLPGCVQMRTNSAFLKDLNSDAVMLKQLNFTSIWTPYDLMIVPANSSQMLLGREVVVSVALHPWMLKDPRSLATVAEALVEPVNSYPQFVYTQSYQKLPLSNDNI
ncbi:MAG: triacylglycerol lipase [Goleter apudmare HA4340-LM2]|jgi:triacylglycerol lipase|nr:triacylglycerol lipase [Goleter apudmare HA4340-LM2]